ncbi:50S ribosomal protein L3 [Victivallis sp. Marseille-Q1083]|uniref:50S ribosomal protein L3 n=1 Tax=Victivallis sp. Marseille-Q1083 TaxID=2717288 RepID=UPI00158E9D74|nr:50S ribosomal protein L3 [Victivallis sp. Marseille-Q1083]
MKNLIGKKIGMTQVYDEQGRIVPVTVIQAGPCVVVDVKTRERDGYSAVQLGFGSRKAKNVSKAVLGHCAKANYKEFGPSFLREFRTAEDAALAIGSELKADVFAKDEYLDVTGTIKGRGFQGVVKRYRFGGGRASHGGAWTRRTGSIGQCEFPGRVDRGKKMPGHMGNARRTIQNLQIVRVMPEDNVLLVRGAVPGCNGGLLLLRNAIKKQSK